MTEGHLKPKCYLTSYKTGVKGVDTLPWQTSVGSIIYTTFYYILHLSSYLSTFMKNIGLYLTCLHNFSIYVYTLNPFSEVRTYFGRKPVYIFSPSHVFCSSPGSLTIRPSFYPSLWRKSGPRTSTHLLEPTRFS